MVLFGKRETVTYKKTGLVTFINPESKVSDQFRTIRTNLQFLSEVKKNGSVLITSPNPGEGKSTMIANLAVSIAQQKRKVLLIDANLRTPSIHKMFRMSNDSGLSNVLQNERTLRECIQHTEIGRLAILPSGPPVSNPAELISNKTMRELIEVLAESYDVVLIDSPAVLQYTETRVLANQCDGVLLVLYKEKTGMDEAIEATKVLELAHANVLGAILNKK